MALYLLSRGAQSICKRTLAMRASILFLLTLLVSTAEAATFYVSTAGNPANSCSTSSSTGSPPCTGGSCARRTLTGSQGGIACMTGGDTLIVEAGTYDEAVMNILPSGSESSPTVLKAAPGATVILSLTEGGNTYGLAFYDGYANHHIIMDGINIDCNNGLCHDGIYVGVSNHHLTFKNLFVKGPYVQGIAHFHGHDVTYDNVEVDGSQAGNYCRFGEGGEGYCQGFYLKGDRITVINSNSHHNHGYGLQYTTELADGFGGADGVILNSRFHHNGATGLLTSNSGPHLIANNLIYNNAFDGVMVAGSTTRILNNSVYSNGVSGIRSNHTSNYTVRNNALRGNGTPEIQGNFESSTVSHNLCQTTSTYCNLAGNPAWLNPANGDFHIAAGSAALNQGATIAEVTSSFYGVSRVPPPGGAYDIGAAEFSAAGPTPTALRWVTPPGTALAGASLPSMSVEVLDETGARLTTSTATITLTLGANPGASSLSGGTAVAAVAGLATFTSVVVSNPGVGYTLVASSGTLTAATSSPFTVTGAPLAVPSALSSVQQTLTATGAIRMGWNYTPSSTPATGFKVYTQASCSGAFTAAPNMPMPRRFLTGVNLSGAEVNPSVLPGTHGTDYLYPNVAVNGYNGVDYYRGKGMTAFRVPVRWERLQPTRNAALNAAEQARLRSAVSSQAGLDLGSIITLDNFGRYTVGGTAHLVGSATVPTADFANVWSRIATVFLDFPLVEFDLMAEPHTMTTEAIVSYSNAAITAIRATGAKQRIHVQGNNWSYPHTWATGGVYGTANSTAMLGISDPLNNTVFAVNLYLDDLTPPPTIGEGECVSTTIGPERLAPFTTWLRANNKKGYLGEVGGPATATCLTAAQNFLDYVRANSDVYAGWSGWAGGPLWATDYPLDLEPAVGTSPDRAQMDTMEPYITEHGARAQTYTVAGLALGSRTCWRVTATTAGEESAPSNTLEWTVPTTTTEPPVTTEEFRGPFASWANVKTDFGAVGDGVTNDTSKFQAAMDVLGTAGQPSVLYVPAGTYRIHGSFLLTNRKNVAVIGENPATTILQWTAFVGTAPEDGGMFRIEGVTQSKFARLTLDGSTSGGTMYAGVNQGLSDPGHFDSSNVYEDMIFRDLKIGIRGGGGGGGFAENNHSTQYL